MRAGLLLEALARNFRVDLWCIPIAGGVATAEFSEQIERQAVARLEVDGGWQLAQRSGEAALRRFGRPSPCRFAASQALAELREAFGMPNYACTVVLRSYLLPFALPLDRAGGELGIRVLDLDDDEALTHRRLADLAATPSSSPRHLESQHRLEAELFEAFEASAVPWAERLLTAQRAHANRLQRRFPQLDVDVLPNAVEVPDGDDVGNEDGSGESRQGSAPRLVFVGNLGYAPNVAAVRELALEVLPALERRGLLAELRLVGRRPDATVTALCQLPRVRVVADAPTLEEHYAWADQAVIPLRAGGGTRIKILEAFAVGVPVVSTPLGAEGLAARDGHELLLRASASDLADGVEQLWCAPGQAHALARRAHIWVREHHERQQVVEQLAESLQQSPPVESNQPSRSKSTTSRSGIG